MQNLANLHGFRRMDAMMLRSIRAPFFSKSQHRLDAAACSLTKTAKLKSGGCGDFVEFPQHNRRAGDRAQNQNGQRSVAIKANS
jgi:hypothetical protein